VQPVIASLAAACAMTQWDLVMDPVNSTVYGLWIWHHGGAFFGVPPKNFLGWFGEMFIAFLAVTLFLRSRNAALDLSSRSRGFWMMPIFLYLSAGLCQIVPWLVSPGGIVMDGAGTAWQVRDIHAAAVVTMLLTMAPTGLLALYRLWRT
jgi:putative membrane protein